MKSERMYIWGVILVSIILLASCSNSTNISVERHSENLTFPSVTANTAINSSSLSSFKVVSLIINDTQQQQEVDQKDPGLLNEFLQFLKNQSYSKPQGKWDEEYNVKLVGQDIKPVLEISFGARSVTLDRDFDFGGFIINKGSYEVEEWITGYLKSFYNGQVLDPSVIKLPAVMKTSGDAMAVELTDNGSSRLNLYDTVPRLHEFIDRNLIDKDFVITGSKVMYGYKAAESETGLIKEHNRCISINYSESENFFTINSDNTIQSFAKAGVLTVARQQDKPCVYKFITDRMVFDVKVSEEFDKLFNELFAINSSTDHQVTPDEIKALSDSKKPGFMEYISKNLGLGNVELRDDYTFETKLLNLDNGSPYKVLTFTDNYLLRMLIFKSNNEKSWSYVGNIDIREWLNKPEYKIKKAGDRIFIVVEKNYRGKGTGYLAYSQDWYSVSNDCVKNVLSIPGLHHEVDSSGFNMELKSLSTISDSKLRLSADYSLSKVYTLYLPISDEQGYVTVPADKHAEFEWDYAQGCFVSKVALDDEGIYSFVSDTKEIKDNCSRILDKYFFQLEKNITSLSSESGDAKRWKARSYKEFLEDCNPGEKIELLKKKLKEACPD